MAIIIKAKDKVNSDIENVFVSIREVLLKKHEEKSNVNIIFSIDMVNGGIGPVNADIKEKIAIKK